MGNLSHSGVAASQLESIAVVPCDGEKVLAAFADTDSKNRASVVIRAAALSSDGIYRFHSPNSLSDDGTLSLGLALNQGFSAVPRETLRAELDGAIRGLCGDSYAVVSGTGRSGCPALVVERITSTQGLPHWERVAEFDYRWNGFIDYRFSPESSRIRTAEDMGREGTTALSILNGFATAFQRLSGEKLGNEKLHLSVEQ